MRQIIISFIKHQEQRLGQVGDWFFDSHDNLHVAVSDLGDWRYNVLFARHEMDEALLCKHTGVTTEMVDDDQAHELPTDDPDSFSGYPGCCYQNQHNDALAAEWVLSRLLGVSWEEYANAVEAIEGKKKNGKEGKGNTAEEREIIREEGTKGA
jgi:hypothetical protein